MTDPSSMAMHPSQLFLIPSCSGFKLARSNREYTPTTIGLDFMAMGQSFAAVDRGPPDPLVVQGRPDAETNYQHLRRGRWTAQRWDAMFTVPGGPSFRAGTTGYHWIPLDITKIP